MDEKSTAPTGIWLKLYIAAGIVVFISIAYIVLNKPQQAAPTATSQTTVNDARAPTVNDTAKEKSDREVIERLEKQAAANPGTDNYLKLGFVYYNAKRYHDCIAMNRKAIELDANLAVAYNNICSAYNALNSWDSADVACNMALKIKPDFTLAKNNLNWTHQMMARVK